MQAPDSLGASWLGHNSKEERKCWSQIGPGQPSSVNLHFRGWAAEQGAIRPANYSNPEAGLCWRHPTNCGRVGEVAWGRSEDGPPGDGHCLEESLGNRYVSCRVDLFLCLLGERAFIYLSLAHLGGLTIPAMYPAHIH